MKIRTGFEKITELNGVEVFIDWDDLLRYRGSLATRDKFDRSFGLLLTVLSVLGLLLSIIWAVMISAWQDFGLFPVTTPQELLFWVSLAVYIYSRYLLRNKTEFAFNLEQRSLSDLSNDLIRKKISRIEFDDYLTYPLLKTLDYDYFDHHTQFVDNLADYILIQPQSLEILIRLGIDPVEFRNRVADYSHSINTGFESHYKGLFAAAFHKAIAINAQHIDSAAFLFVFLEHLWSPVLLDFEVTPDEVEAMQVWVGSLNKKQEYLRTWRRLAFLKPTGVVNKSFTSVYARVLETFGDDYTRQAATGRFELTSGRDSQILAIEDTLRINNSAVLLVGPSGVGKSQILRHLAVKMVVEDVPPELQDKRLISFDFGRAFTESGSLDDFKLLIQELFDELARTQNIVVVLDEIHQIFNIRDEYRNEIISILQNGIQTHNSQVIATTNQSSYQKFIESNQTIASLFEVVDVLEPTPQVTLQILIDEAVGLENRFGVAAQIDSLKQIVKLAPSFDHEKVMPQKAIQLFEQSMISAQQQGLKFLTEDVVADVVSKQVGTNVGPLSESEAAILAKIEDELHKRVVGQKQAISAVAGALRRSRAGFKDDKKPIAALMFYGPTGVGKTEVCKTLAATYYGDEHLLIRLDMSEYQEDQNLDRLIGVVNEKGEFSGGYLTEAVRRKPFSLVMLDELEKANPKVLDLFLQIIDEGYVTDGMGRKVSFTNCIIIATSNAGSTQIADLVASGADYTKIANQVEPILRQVFRVEFLNRFDQLVMFKPLSAIEVQEVARRMLGSVRKSMLEQGIEVKISDLAIQELAHLGYDPVYGARQLNRSIQDNLENKLAELIVTGQIKSGSEVEVVSLGDFRVKK